MSSHFNEPDDTLLAHCFFSALVLLSREVLHQVCHAILFCLFIILFATILK